MVPTHLALLWGINVRGNNKLPMNDPRDLFIAAGCHGYHPTKPGRVHLKKVECGHTGLRLRSHGSGRRLRSGVVRRDEVPGSASTPQCPFAAMRPQSQASDITIVRRTQPGTRDASLTREGTDWYHR